MDCVWRCAECGDLIWAGRDEFGDPTPWWHVDGPRPHDHPATPHDNPPHAAPSVVHPEPGDRAVTDEAVNAAHAAWTTSDAFGTDMWRECLEAAAPFIAAAAVAAVRADLDQMQRALDYSNNAREIMRAEKEHGWREAEKWEARYDAMRADLAAQIEALKGWQNNELVRRVDVAALVRGAS